MGAGGSGAELYSLGIYAWAVKVTFAGMLFSYVPFFHANVPRASLPRGFPSHPFGQRAGVRGAGGSGVKFPGTGWRFLR